MPHKIGTRPAIVSAEWIKKLIGSSQIFDLPHDLAWQTIPSVSKPRVRSYAFPIEGKVWVVGGVDEFDAPANIEVFDPTNNAWTVIPNPFSYLDPACVAASSSLGTKIYAIGGVGPGFTYPVKTVQEYDPKQGTLIQKADLPVLCMMAGIASDKGKIYVMGGIQIDYNVGSVTHINKLQVFDTQTNTWTIKADMPTARYEIASAVGSDGLIYAIGGFDPSTDIELSVVEAYNPTTNTWVQKAPMTAPRRCHAAVSVGDHIYVLGGLLMCSGGSSVEAYDPTINQWMPRAPMPSGRWSLAATTLNNNIYAIGGCNRVGDYQPGNPNCVILKIVEKATVI